jgi:general secretion pathway protein G
MRHTHSNRRNSVRRGFTLVEVIVVVTLLAVLMTVVGSNMARFFGKGQSKIAVSQAAKISQAYDMYRIEMGGISPEDDFDLSILALRYEDGGGPGGPFLSKSTDVIDPWGNPFVVVVDDNTINFDYDVLSLGADGAPGGDQADMDITQ